MRSWRVLARACAAGGLLATTPAAAHAQSAPGLIPAIQVDGRGHGHGVGMAQDGALAMGRAGADVKQILGQFYPGTSIGKASGSVRVPVFTGNSVTLAFPEGGEIRGYPAASNPNASPTLRVEPGGSAVITRDGDGARVQTSSAPPPTTSPTSTSTTAATTTSTTEAPPPTSTTLLPRTDERRGPNAPAPTLAPSPSTTTTSTTAPAATSRYVGAITAAPTGDGRVGVVARNRRYRGTMEVTAVQGGLRVVNQVGVETYLRGMGEVRNPSWPAAGLQAQSIAARTYALRAMAVGGELCDTQRCQVYIGSDAEYAAMDKAVAATAGQVLMHGKSLASAVYSANAGGHTAGPEEGFGMPGGGYPYLRPAPYLTDNRSDWTITIALSDVARRLNYRGTITSIEVDGRGASGRATSVRLHGSANGKTVSGLEFDASLGLKSTLFTVKNVMAEKVATLTGGSVLQAPPDDASAIAEAVGSLKAVPTPPAVPLRAANAATSDDNIELWSLIGAALWGAVVVSAFRWRRVMKPPGAHFQLS